MTPTKQLISKGCGFLSCSIGASRCQRPRERLLAIISLEVEIRKLLHEIRRIAEQALTRARAARAEGASAVQAARARLECLEREIGRTQAM
jgi:hypothetical protein